MRVPTSTPPPPHPKHRHHICWRRMNVFSPLSSTNSKIIHYLLSYFFGLNTLSLNSLRGTKTTLLVPKKFNQNPVHFTCIKEYPHGFSSLYGDACQVIPVLPKSFEETSWMMTEVAGSKEVKNGFESTQV